MGKYDDIIDTEWMGVRNHKRMPIKERAKIFGSFSALKGYEEAIQKKRQTLEQQMELADELILNIDKEQNAYE